MAFFQPLSEVALFLFFVPYKLKNMVFIAIDQQTFLVKSFICFRFIEPKSIFSLNAFVIVVTISDFSIEIDMFQNEIR